VTKRRLGEILLGHGWITRADLSRALKAQQLVGGRIGTCLLEAESISEEMLARGLAEQSGIAAAAIGDLRQVDAETLSLLPRALAVRCRAVPIRATGSRLEIATSEPDDLACQDEIAFATSRRLRVLIAAEARIVGALDRHYGEAAPNRFVGLLERLDRHRVGKPAERATSGDELFPETRPVAAPVPPSPPATPGGQAPAVVGVGGSPASRPAALSLSETERTALLGPTAAPIGEPADQATAPPGRAAAEPPAGDAPSSFAAASRQLDTAVDRDEVGRILLGFLRQLFDRAALFAAKSDGVHGWMGAGDGLDRERLADLTIPFDRASVFLNLKEGSALHLGPLPPMPAHRPLITVLGGDDPPGPCILLPVRFGERLAVVLYGDRDGAPVTGIDLEGLRHLAEQASVALERCISLKKQAHSGPAAG
jgi:hypothetical protein